MPDLIANPPVKYLSIILEHFHLKMEEKMKRLPTVILMILALIAILTLGTISASAQATKTDFASQERLAPIGPPGKSWVSDDGVLHLRDFPVAGPVWGELTGNLTVVANINQDIFTGDGTGYGTAFLEVDDFDGMQGTFEGRSQWKYTNGMVTKGQFVGHGTGDFDGMQVMANFYDEADYTVLSGTILSPHGD